MTWVISANTGTIYYGVVVLMSHKKNSRNLPKLDWQQSIRFGFFVKSLFVPLILSSCEALLGLLGSNDDVWEFWLVHDCYLYLGCDGKNNHCVCNDGTHQKQSREKSTGSGFLHYYILKYYRCATNYHHIILLKSFGCDPISAIYWNIRKYIRDNYLHFFLHQCM